MKEKKQIKLRIVNCKAEYKVADEGRIIEAYVSIFNNIDSYGDIIVKGAFDESIKKKLPVGAWAHNWDEPIAKTLEAREDDKGLYIKAKFVEGVQKADEAYKLIKEGVITEFSIGFSVLEDETNKEGNRILKKIKLYEWSPVLAGANDATEVINIKNLEVEEEDEKGAVQDTLTAEQVWEKKWDNLDKVREIINAFFEVYLNEINGVDTFNSFLSETVDLLKAILPADSTASKDLVKELLGKSKTEYCVKDLKINVLAASEELNKKIEQLKADIQSFKDGRVLSEKNRTLVQEVADGLDALSSNISNLITPLKDLLSATEPKGEDKEIEKKENLSPKILRIRQAVKQIDKASEFVLKIIKSDEKNKDTK